MLAPLVTCLALVPAVFAAPSDTKANTKDLKYALKQLEKDCGVFFKRKGIRWSAVKKEMLAACKEVESEQDFYMLLNRLIARVEDGHAYVKVPKGAGVKWPDPGPWKGPGLFFTLSGKPGSETVVVKNSWADSKSAGVEAGAIVLEVDDQPAAKWLAAKVAELRDEQSFSTDQQARFFACHWGLAGPAGSQLKLRIRRPDGKVKKARIARKSGTYVPWGPVVFPEGLERIGRNRYGKLPSGFGYIHLRKVTNDLAGELDTMLAKIGEVPGLVLDCRANGGGGTDHGAVFGRFVPKGETFESYRSAGDHPYGGPMVVLIDAGVRSAGETISGMFKLAGRALLIGPAPTAGMSSSKKFIELPSKRYSLFVSWKSNGRDHNKGQGIEGIGVHPDDVVPYDPKRLADGVDPLIERAEELLRDFPDKRVAYKPGRHGWKPPK